MSWSVPERAQAVSAICIILISTIIAELQFTSNLVHALPLSCALRASDTNGHNSTTPDRLDLACQQTVSASDNADYLRAIDQHFGRTEIPWYIWALFVLPFLALLAPIENELLVSIGAVLLSFIIAWLALYPAWSVLQELHV